MEAATYAEKIALDDAEPRLRRRGYKLIRKPSEEQLPDFLGGYRPDAIALGPSPSLVIEVKQRRSSSSDAQIRRIQQILKDRDDWQLDVIYISPVGVPLRNIEREYIQKTIDDVRRLASLDSRASLLLGWAVLEAVARSLEPDMGKRSMSAGTLTDLLVSMGHLSQDDGALLRKLGQLRNEIAHGQVDQDPDESNVLDLASLASKLMRST